MSLYAVPDTKLTAIADAIREKDGLGTATVDEMPERIRALPGGTDVITMDFKTFDIDIPTASYAAYRFTSEQMPVAPSYLEIYSLEDTLVYNPGSKKYWIAAACGLNFRSTTESGTKPQVGGVIALPSKVEKTWTLNTSGSTTYTGRSAADVTAYKDASSTYLSGSMQTLRIRNSSGTPELSSLEAGLSWHYDPSDAKPFSIEPAITTAYLKGRYRVIWR